MLHVAMSHDVATLLPTHALHELLLKLRQSGRLVKSRGLLYGPLARRMITVRV